MGVPPKCMCVVTITNTDENFVKTAQSFLPIMHPVTKLRQNSTYCTITSDNLYKDMHQTVYTEACTRSSYNSSAFTTM